LLNRDGKNTKKDAWIQYLMDRDILPALNIVEKVETKEDAEEREIHWIKEHLKTNPYLTNSSGTGKPRTHKKIDLNQINILPGMSMTQTELEYLIRSEGCTPIPRPRRGGEIYFYASHRKGKKMREVYISPKSKIQDLTEDQVLEKLAKIK
jgi:hypothetical protein